MIAIMHPALWAQQVSSLSSKCHGGAGEHSYTKDCCPHLCREITSSLALKYRPGMAVVVWCDDQLKYDTRLCCLWLPK